MDKKILGVDISKETFDVICDKGNHKEYQNNIKGFKLFLKNLTKNSLVVMESTGYFHISLAQFLSTNGISVSVVNPLAVKRFIQMKFNKVKTDKNDAKFIKLFAEINDVPLYKAKNSEQLACLQLVRMIEFYKKKSISLKNKIHAEKTIGRPSKAVYHSLNRSLKSIQKEIKLLESELLQMIEKNQKKQLQLLMSIPGIGVKTASMLIIMTEGFSNFQNAKQLCNHIGITPMIIQSGKRTFGRSRITKKGNKTLRNLLFLCSFTACQHNKSCRKLFERIVAKGKSKKLALIAVANKLLKQAFAIAKSGLAYDENFVSKLA